MKKALLSALVVLTGITMVGAGCGTPKETLPPAASRAVQPQEPANPPVNNPTVDPIVTPPAVETVPTTSQPVTPPVSTTTTLPTATKGQSLSIAQWGVSLNLPAGIADLQYSLKRDSSTGNGYAYFSTKNLVAKGGEACEAPRGPLGVLVQAKKLESDGPSQLPPVNEMVKIGDVYYYYMGPQDTCTGDKAIQAMIDKQRALLEDAIKTVYKP